MQYFVERLATGPVLVLARLRSDDDVMESFDPRTGRWAENALVDLLPYGGTSLDRISEADACQIAADLTAVARPLRRTE